MILVQPKVEKYNPGENLSGMYESIEYAARICTATQNKMSNDSKKFVDNLVKRKHGRALEFGTVYLHLNIADTTQYYIAKFYANNRYSKVNIYGNDYYVTTNYRVLVENNKLDELSYWSDDVSKCPGRYYLHWHISRVTADSFRTHTMLSSLMQSTRFCNYSLDKFGKEIKIARPLWLSGKLINGMSYNMDNISSDYLDRDSYLYMVQTISSEKTYIQLTDRDYEEHLSSEQARGILPLDLYTEFIQCGFKEDWENFFDQRMRETTGKPHPDAKYISEKGYDIIYN